MFTRPYSTLKKAVSGSPNTVKETFGDFFNSCNSTIPLGEQPRLPLLITPFPLIATEAVECCFYSAFNFQTSPPRGPSRTDLCPELDTPSYQILENTLLSHTAN